MLKLVKQLVVCELKEVPYSQIVKNKSMLNKESTC